MIDSMSARSIFLSFLLSLTSLSALAAIDGGSKMTIKVYLPDRLSAIATGARAEVYLDGLIEEDTLPRVVAALAVYGVKGGSIYLNSVGGSMFAAMKLGRMLRQQGFDTTVGKDGAKRYNAQPGGCYSACVLAYLGGKFRYSKEGSQFGVHRFSAPTHNSTDLEAAQVASAAIINYLIEMGADTALFDRMVRAGANQIYILSDAETKRLRVVNDGVFPAVWSVNIIREGTYLKGVQVAWYGKSKMFFMCEKGQLLFMPMLLAGNNTSTKNDASTIVSTTVKHSIRLDDDFVPLDNPTNWQADDNGYVSGGFQLSPSVTRRLKQAESIGYAAQPGPVIFWGFKMETSTAGDKIVNFVDNCQRGH